MFSLLLNEGFPREQVGAVSFARRLRTLALLPQIFRSSENGGTVPPSEPGNVRTLFVVALLWGIDKLVGRTLRMVRLAGLPSSIVSLLLSYAGLSVIEVASGKHVAEQIMRFFQPGIDFLGRWMMAVYTVSTVPLPSNLGAFRGVGDFVKFSVLHATSWLFAITSTALLVRSLPKARTPTGGDGGERRGGGTKPPLVSQVKTHRAAVRSVWTTLTAASYALVPWLGEAPVRRCTVSLPVHDRSFLARTNLVFLASCASYADHNGYRRAGAVLDAAKLASARRAAASIAAAARIPSDCWYVWTIPFRCCLRDADDGIVSTG